MSVLLFPRLFLLFRVRRALSFFLGATFFFKTSRFRRLLRLHSREFEFATLRLIEIVERLFFSFGAEMTFARF